MKSKLSALALVLFFSSAVYAADDTQTIRCEDDAPVSAQVGRDLVKFDLSGTTGKGRLAWINEQNNSDIDTGTLVKSGLSKKHPGYTVYSGGCDDGSGKILFALPTDLIGKTGSVKFTGYFYDLENDGGPDVPLGFTMSCTSETQE